MKNKIALFYLLPFLLLIIDVHPTNAQGCSDAGFCTMGAMKPGQPFKKNSDVSIRSIEVSQYMGINKVNDIMLVTQLDGNIGIKGKNTIQIKIPYFNTIGILGNTGGFGDLSLGYTRLLTGSEKWQLNATLGTKIPIGQSNITDPSGRPFPNYYQPSLGTYDLIVGISLMSRGWLFAAGYQLPLTESKNQFLWGPWFKSEDSTLARKYPVSKNIRRGNDIMLRVEKSFRFSNISAHIGLLGIYRINNDRITTKDGVNNHEVPGTNGLVLNLIGALGYNLNAHHALKISAGYRIVKRYYDTPETPSELSLDGLSRIFVCTLGYEIKF